MTTTTIKIYTLVKLKKTTFGTRTKLVKASTTVEELLIMRCELEEQFGDASTWFEILEQPVRILV